jgi:hypothetical protein
MLTRTQTVSRFKRELHCVYSSSLSGGGAGSVREQGYLCCIAELNLRRAKQLRDLMDTLP